MSPDAAATLAQVDATLLVALVVEAKGITSQAKDEDLAQQYVIGLYGVFLSLAVTLTSVVYNKALGAWPDRIAFGGTFVSCYAVFTETIRHLSRREGVSRRRRAPMLLVMVAGLVWFAVWIVNFVPNLFFWDWF